MDIEKLVAEAVSEHARDFHHAELEAVVVRLIREAVAEAIAENDREWQKTYDEAVNNPPAHLIKIIDAEAARKEGA